MTDKELAEDSFASKKMLYKANSDRRSYIDGFLAGLQAGKDMSVATKWHRVADGDYPPCEKGNYTINVLSDKGDVVYYSYDYECWIVEPSSAEIDPPAMWCELPRCEVVDSTAFDCYKSDNWHDLRKNPNDLPKECEIVLCYCLGYCGVSYPITARMHTDCEDSSVHYWWTLGGEGKSEKLDNVLAWKEIVMPKE